jgi:NADPH:quinone reductase-like Zn-dependent oxidoreductase
MHSRLQRSALTVTALALVALAPRAHSETIRQWQLVPRGETLELALREVEAQAPAAHEVAVRVRAVSLNRRDLMMVEGRYGRGSAQPNSVPLSDGAGEVVAVGANVTRFKVGDRVAGIFFEDWLDGAPTAASIATARGGNAGGMLSEIVVTDAEGLVTIPAHLSYEEAATLPCAGVTAWVGLFKRGGLERGDFVLLEGTGGVSVFGLQLAAAAGAKPIITSSSDTKLARARELGAFGTVNYRTNPEWQNEVRALTGGAGVAASAASARLRRSRRDHRRLVRVRKRRARRNADGSERNGERDLRRLARRFRSAQRILERAQDRADRR